MTDGELAISILRKIGADTNAYVVVNVLDVEAELTIDTESVWLTDEERTWLVGLWGFD